MATQTKFGKAFEYACLKALNNRLSGAQNVVVESTPTVVLAKSFYENADYATSRKMDSAATAAVRVIARLEPQLEHPQNNTPLILSLQQDSRGIAGDVRDVLCVRKQNEWEIGLSCKHNHFAVKHSRLSNTIDFGMQWFNRPCSEKYFEEIAPLFHNLRVLQANGKLWRNISNKADRFMSLC